MYFANETYVSIYITIHEVNVLRSLLHVLRRIIIIVLSPGYVFSYIAQIPNQVNIICKMSIKTYTYKNITSTLRIKIIFIVMT